MSNFPDQVDRAALIAEIKLLRERGLPRLPNLQLPMLRRAAEHIIPDPALDDRARVETAFRKAVEKLGGGPYGESAGLLFGLVQGTRAHSSRVRREEAAAAVDRVADTFRKRYEPAMIEEIADNLLSLVATQDARTVWTQMETRHPADSRLAVHWVERFESYYRLWTPIYALGADLTASRSTMLEVDRPFDRAGRDDDPADVGYSQEDQATGYAAFALYRYASFLWELQQFMIRHGGLWLFASPETEIAARDAIYRIGWHVTPFNERDDSWLRQIIGQNPQREMHPFLSRLTDTAIGRATHEEWLQWINSCECTWELAVEDGEYFPTSERHISVDVDCQMHQAISACNTYCRLIDREWYKVADWYQLNATTNNVSVTGEKLYDGLDG